jgi:hypothetical protein
MPLQTSEIPESPGCVSGSAKLSEKRMHFVREKRDKREKSPDGGRLSVTVAKNISAKSAVSAISPLFFLCRLAGRLRVGCRSGTLLLRWPGTNGTMALLLWPGGGLKESTENANRDDKHVPSLGE